MSKFDEGQRTGRKVGEVLKYRDAGLSVEDAKKAMFAAGQQPGKGKLVPMGIQPAEVEELPDPAVMTNVPVVPVAQVAEEDFVEETTTVVPPVAAAPTAPIAPPKVERVENDKFVGEIKQEGGKWVAEIKYKSGSGTERFFGSTKNELMMKLLEGKGHATLRVNKAVRREKFGFSELDRQYKLPEHMTTADFEKMDEKQQDHLLWTIANQAVLDFRDAHPDFYRDPEKKNAKKIQDLLAKEKLPITVRNLEYAFEELSDPNLPVDVRLEERPGQVPDPTSLAPSVAAPVQTDSAPAPVAPVITPVIPGVPAGTAVTIRKRGTTGLQPGQSSSESELGSPEAGGGPRQLSEAEAKKLPMSELTRIVKAERRQNAAQR